MVGEKDVSVRRYDEASSPEECMMRYVRRTSIAKRLPMLESERSLSHGNNDPIHALVTIEVTVAGHRQKKALMMRLQRDTNDDVRVLCLGGRGLAANFDPPKLGITAPIRRTTTT
ncbi:hypothetical protein VNO77_19259 [Canavalia gladiata]|uniref:Uncharacterized protein n=1 Tax=Canavalia gladiata TaxID=3824 RepID=A0AAN9LMC2_CANGL